MEITKEIHIGKQIMNVNEKIAKQLEDEMSGLLCAWSLFGYKTWSVIENLQYGGYDFYMYLMDEQCENKIRIEFSLDQNKVLVQTRVSSYDKILINGSFRSTSDECNNLIEPIANIKHIM